MQPCHPQYAELRPLVVYKLPFEEYTSIPAANASGLKKVLRSPAHYLHSRKNPEAGDSSAMQFGRMLHGAFLETEEFRHRFRVYPDFGTGKGSRTSMWDWEAAQRDEEPDCILIKQNDADRLTAMIKALRAHPLASEILSAGAAEVTLTWNDPAFRMGCKARVDYLVKKAKPIFADLKTTRDASPDAFSRAAYSMGYDIQAAHYTEGGLCLFGERPMFCFIALENEPPHEVAVYVATEALLDIGLSRRNRAMRRLQECIEKQEFRGYGTEPINLFLPHYAFYQEEDQND